MAKSRNDTTSVSIHRYGVTLDDRKRKVQCLYCKKVVSGFYRLKFHIGGVRGDVAPCDEAPPNMRELFRGQILEAKGKSLAQDLDYSSDESAAAVNACTGGRVLTKRGAGDSEAPVSKEVAEYFLEIGIDIQLADSPSFQTMLGETNDEVDGGVLQEQLMEVQEKVKTIRETWDATGCTILIDEWVDGNDRCLVNFLVQCPDGLVYLRSADITDITANNAALQNLLDGVIEEVGQQNVVQVMTCSTTGWMFPVVKQIKRSHMHIFWAVSASDCIGLMLEKIAAINDIRSVLDEAKSLVRFVHNNATVLKLFRDFTGSERENLFRPSKMKSAIPFLILESILSCKDELKEMFTSLKWKSSFWSKKTEGKKAAGLVKKSSFWKRAKSASKATTALIRVIDKITVEDKHSIGFIYETMDQIKEAIQYEFGNIKSRYMPLWKLIDEIWDDFLHSPLHAAAYHLNPSFFYTRNFLLDTEVSNGLQCSVIRMEKDQQIQCIINDQVDKFCRADGSFQEGYAADTIKNADPEIPDRWWSEFGNHCPELQRLAIRILSQTCDGAVRYLINRSVAEKLVNKGHNQLEQDHFRDLMFVHYNLQLLEFNKKKRKAGGEIGGEGPSGSHPNKRQR